MSAQGPDEALSDDTDSDSEFHECQEWIEPEAQPAVATSAVGSEGMMLHASEQQEADDMIIEAQLDAQHAQLVNCEKFEGQKVCNPESQPGAAAVLDASVEAADIATPTSDAAVQDVSAEPVGGEPDCTAEPPTDRFETEQWRHWCPQWVADDAHSACMLCEAGFGLFRRRHHCRVCGWLLCESCSCHRIELPVALGKVVLQPSGPTTQAEGGILYRACADCRNRVRLWKPPQTGAESTPARSVDLQEPGGMHATPISRADAVAVAQEESAESVLAANIERHKHAILADMEKNRIRPSLQKQKDLEAAMAAVMETEEILQDLAVIASRNA